MNDQPAIPPSKPTGKRAEKWIKEANEAASTARRTVLLWTLAAATLFVLRIANVPMLVTALETYRYNSASSSSLRELDQEMQLYAADGEWGEILTNAFEARLKTWQGRRAATLEQESIRLGLHTARRAAAETKQNAVLPSEQASQEADQWRKSAKDCPIQALRQDQSRRRSSADSDRRAVPPPKVISAINRGVASAPVGGGTEGRVRSAAPRRRPSTLSRLVSGTTPELGSESTAGQLPYDCRQKRSAVVEAGETCEVTKVGA